MIGADLSWMRFSTCDSRWPRGMWMALANAPWSNSSGSRTSRTVMPPSAMRDSAVAVSISSISALALASKSRNVAMIKAYPLGRDLGTLWIGLDEAGQDVADLPSENDVSEMIHPPRFGVDDDHRRPGAPGDRDHAGDRIHLQRRADGEQQVARFGGAHCPLDHVWHKILAEADRVALEDAVLAALAASAAIGIHLAGTHTIENGMHRLALTACPAHRPMHGAVNLDDELRGATGLLMQAVDVLGDKGVQRSSALELDDGPMPAVRSCAPCRVRQPVLPRGAAH